MCVASAHFDSLRRRIWRVLPQVSNVNNDREASIIEWELSPNLSLWYSHPHTKIHKEGKSGTVSNLTLWYSYPHSSTRANHKNMTKSGDLLNPL
ncbi:Uncharacterized protein TCM_033009 [Theobroma cacao]|uniref:Uncharacterized protein n=1 Tax=Theobroma cacao TaxID=3641 RepID=A0A061F9G8_THECC|nr:Uncharacterized protein TCM_033009 [Theobroma cacao]